MEDDPVLACPRQGRQGYPAFLQLMFATRAKSKLYRVPAATNSMIDDPDVTVAAMEDIAKTFSR